MEGRHIRLQATVVLLALTLAAPMAAQKHENGTATAATQPELIWRDPGDVTALDLLNGAGGRQNAPDPNGTYTFVAEDAVATSPKFDADDAQGVRWKVKLGAEPQSETAATRLLWAAGYFVDEDYYLPEIKVAGLPKLQRGEAFVSAGGIVHRVRLERHLKDVKHLAEWNWFHNPFVGTRELNGLKIMMALVNNWDLSAANNSIYEVAHERHYLVSDVGATFGKTGNNFGRSKSDLKDFSASKFIDGTSDELVDFVMHSRSFFLSIVVVNNYRDRARMEQVTRHIPRADARWLGQRLAQLSDEQLRNSFRAAGYSPEDVDGYAHVVRTRIADLEAL